MKSIHGKDRSDKQIVEHYKIEKELANELKSASKEERKKLYTKLYDELFRRVPHHPQLMRKSAPQSRHEFIRDQVKILSNYFSSEHTFLEVGPGDCTLSVAMCKYFKHVCAVDVSHEITSSIEAPDNFELIISDGTSVDIMPQTVHVAFSNQLMEHLHPDDAFEQLQNIYNVIVPGGVYICLTPHRFMGPADISRGFDEIATGFHLKEYSNKELYVLCRSVGFKKIQSFVNVKGMHAVIPIYPAIIVESIIGNLSYTLRRKISRTLIVRHLLNIQLIATK